ncbi:conserved exported hypothetical protein [Rhodococcus sp. RD6.2]|jgi:hypothetical protein|uniref:hypothetical protein n=1 Tax=Rhodococcus sp. RD6.2 TaxID=260936 RepID=UPI00063B21B8|nr:hypothetical protein [Rhodococcus sp. RD6.2]CRK54383.1 conserved exported hypothetical protein [Rhodococcus sp. RD6.2]
MRTTHRAAAVAAISATVLLVTSVGTAQAMPFDLVGGRERVKVTVASDIRSTCNFYVDDKFVGNVLVEPDAPQSRVYPAAAGARSVDLWCAPYPDGIFELAATTKSVTVEPANPALELVDGILGGVGLGGLATDPTLRP